MPMSSSTASGRSASARSSASGAGRARRASRGRRARAAAPGSRPRRRCRRRRACAAGRAGAAGAGARAGRRRRRAALRQRQRTTNSLPWPRPVAAARRRCRRAARPGCATSVRPMPRPPCARSSELSTCANISNTPPSWSGAMPMPSSRTLTTACRAGDARRRPRPGRRAGVNLHGVVEQVAEHLRRAARGRACS